jgi:hypothetical protein
METHTEAQGALGVEQRTVALENVTRRLCDRIAHVEQRLQQTTAALAAAIHTAPPADKPKGAKPEKFCGSKHEAATVRLWVGALNNYFATTAWSDTDRLQYAVTLLRDNALLWWESMAPGSRPTSYASFCDALVAYYQPVSAQMAARDEIAALRQTDSVKAYTDAFLRQLANIPDMSPSEKLDRYTRGLKPDIRVQVALARAATMEAAMELAERADEIMFRSSRPSAPFAGYHNGGNYDNT